MKQISEGEILKKLYSFCAYQERCEQEVLEKLTKLEVSKEVQKSVVRELKENDFLNEIRFSKIYCRGKFTYKNWGRIKIEFELASKNVSRDNIKIGLTEIDEKEYLQTINKLIKKKEKTLIGENKLIQKEKISKYLFNKGFESEIIWEALNKV